ncbi:YneF family protein [Candidatus Phytoplasma melaleucae]|nr:YneF family protein ['Melaleuca sp.' phytoplasma]MDV3205306.1 YneF family protein [Weeping tea tree witches'-broom phytoplasma]
MNWSEIMFLLLGLGMGIMAGALIMFICIKRYLDKNPPITEKQIKEMFKQMGRNPSEKQIKQVMSAMRNKK